jgi:bacterial leucyl aminopeptidase
MNVSRMVVASATLATSLLGAAHAGPMVWVSMDEAAYQLLREAGTRMEQVESKRLAVQVPRAKGGTEAGNATVYLLRVDQDALSELSHEMHEKLNRCGGYFAHASREEGRRTIARFVKPPVQPLGKPNYNIDNQDEVNALLPQLQESQVRSTITKLSTEYKNRFYTTTGGVSASDDLEKTWKKLAGGRTDVTVKQYKHASWPQRSVIMTIQGTTKPKEIVVIGGHLDSTIGNTTENSIAPGADDDASGIASLQEVARVLLSSGYKPRRTIQFMAYAAEEVGLRGSAAIAAEYRIKGKKVVGALQLDMTNYKGGSPDIAMINDYTNAGQNRFVKDLAAHYLPELTVVDSACGYACSDHASWTNNGFVASFPFEAPMGQHSPWIHTPQDTLDKSGDTANHAIKFSRLGLAYAVELGSDGPAPAAKKLQR